MFFSNIFGHAQDTSLVKKDHFSDSVFFSKKRQLKNAYQSNNSVLIAKCHIQLGEYYQDAEVYSEAVEQYNLSIENIANAEDTLEVLAKNYLGEIQIALKNYTKAQTYLEGSRQLAEKLNYHKGVALAEGLIGTCYEKKGEYLKALKHQKISLSIVEKLNNKKGIATVNENIGSIYEDLAKFNKAYTYFEKANNYFKTINSPKQINTLNNLGDVYRKTGNYEEALHYTAQALEMAKKEDNLHQIESAYKDLSEIYADKNDFENAYAYFLKYDAIQNKLFYSQNFRQVNALQTIYDTREKESKIALLTQQNEVNRANQTLLIVGMSALLVFFGIFYVYRNRKRREKSKLQQYEQKLLQVKLDKKAIEEKKLTDEIHLKTASLSKYSLHIAQKNKLISDLSGTLKNIAARSKMDASAKIKQLAKTLDNELKQEEEWEEFMNFFKNIHPNFMRRLSSIASEKLSTTELRLAMLLRLNLSSKEIASILRVTPDSVRVARYRFRKKIPIQPTQKLDNFLREI